MVTPGAPCLGERGAGRARRAPVLRVRPTGGRRKDPTQSRAKGQCAAGTGHTPTIAPSTGCTELHPNPSRTRDRLSISRPAGSRSRGGHSREAEGASRIGERANAEAVLRSRARNIAPDLPGRPERLSLQLRRSFHAASAASGTFSRAQRGPCPGSQGAVRLREWFGRGRKKVGRGRRIFGCRLDSDSNPEVFDLSGSRLCQLHLRRASSRKRLLARRDWLDVGACVGDDAGVVALTIARGFFARRDLSAPERSGGLVASPRASQL